jgi:SSS family solute:Na+ symporter
MPAHTITLSSIDLLVVGAYLVGLLAIGGRRRAGEGSEEFLLAGRRLSLPLFVGSLVSSWYGGLLGVGEIAYSDGLVNWVSQGGFWYLAYLLFAFVLAEKLARSHATTLPDQLELLHGRTARHLATLLNYVNVVPVSYVLSLGLAVRLFTGWPLWVGILVGAALGTVYSMTGGFRAMVRAQLLQFTLMCLGVASVIPFAVHRLGGADYLRANLPPAHLQPVGAYTAQELVVWALIALSTLVDPGWYQRCYAARSPRTARTGILCAVGFWVLFDVCTTFSGIYARAALPGVDPKLAYPLLANLVLPVGLKGLYVAGLLSTIMSTFDAYVFVGGTAIGHDVVRRGLRREDERSVVGATRLGMVATASLAALLALLFDRSIKSIWKTIGSLTTSAILVPMLLGTAGWRAPGAGVASMLGGATGTLGWAALRLWGPSWAGRVEALVPGLALALTAFVLATLLRRRAR